MMLMTSLLVLSMVSIADSIEEEPLQLIVMDPLALPLSCPCVEGYAQRDYPKLAEFLSQQLGRDIDIEFSESLVQATKELTEGRADIVIGKDSVVRADAKTLDRKWKPIAALTGRDGTTTQTGLVVVKTDDPAKSPDDLAGYRLVLGPKESEEKHRAAIALFAKYGFKLSGELEIAPACDAGSMLVLESPETVRIAAVISSYAKPILEGCGKVDKGSLRVIAKTEPVPFITAFVSQELEEELQGKVRQSLIQAAKVPQLRVALETQKGFIEWPKKDVKGAEEKKTLKSP